MFVTNVDSVLHVFRGSSVSTIKDNLDHKQHSPLVSLEWDSYPFSDGDWPPGTEYSISSYRQRDKRTWQSVVSQTTLTRS